MTDYPVIINVILAEVSRARSMYPKFASAHEGYAVLLEEMTELQSEVFKSPKNRDYKAMKEEAIQVAAMAIRFLIDVTPKENSIETTLPPRLIPDADGFIYEK